MEHASLVGKQLGAYRIQARLGEGGMAWVYKGYHDGLQREAAIKVILPEYADHPDSQALPKRSSSARHS
jgi:serine/threonine protein kinase